MSTTSTTTKANVIKDIQVGDIFSESSHYIVTGKNKGTVTFTHTESGESVNLSETYVQNLLTSADQYFSEKTVGKEDKKDGEQGIRSIWEGIHTSEAFAVCFRKQDTALSKTKLDQLRNDQIANAITAIEQAQKNKKGVANVAKQVIADIQANPINPIEPGESRVLRGYKIQFESRLS